MKKKYKPQLFNHNEAGKVGFFNVKRVLWFLEALVLQELFFLRKFKDKGRSVKGVLLSPGENSQYHLSILAIDLVTVFDAILTSRQTREKLQCLYENLMSVIL